LRTNDTVKMLYEMIGIARPGKVEEVKEIAYQIGKLILQSGGVIRDISNWGVFDLPRPIRRHYTTIQRGHHFVMMYDANPQTHQQIRTNMALEPRVMRATHVRLGNDKLPNLARFHKIEWNLKHGSVPNSVWENTAYGRRA